MIDKDLLRDESYSQKIKDIYDAYSYGCLELNEWEKKFVSDMEFKKDSELSFKQKNIIDKIYKKA